MYEIRTSDFLIHEIRVFDFQKYEFRTFKHLREINKKILTNAVQIPYNITGRWANMKDSRIEVRVSKEEKEMIDIQAKKENLKTSTFIRKVVLDYVQNKEER